MAKLSRTQKYADLRSELANDKETTTASQDLSSYADRFNNVQETLAPKPVQEARPQYSFQGQSMPSANNGPAYNPYQASQQASYSNYQQAPQNNQNSYFDSFMNAPVQEKKDDFNSFFEAQTSGNNYRGVFNDVNDTTDNTISRKERDTYLNQTISDVNFHNLANGQQSINQIIDQTVNQVRHTQDVRPAYNEPAVEDNTYAFNNVPKQNQYAPLDADQVSFEQVSDDEFTNTVSMEITKIMDQMNTLETKQQAPVANPYTQAAPVQPVQQVKIEEPVVQAAPVAQVQYEEPKVNVSNMVINEVPEEVVEIKNFDEIKDEPLKNTVSGTIPFVVSSQDDEDIEDDEENEGSNTVLNVILIVLIIVLMAVLGLIIFYILKTKGIF